MTILLFGVFFVFLIILGIVFSYIMDSYLFVLIFGIIAAVYIIVAYYNSDKIVLAISRARPATVEEFPRFVHTVEEMSIASGMKKPPRTYVIDDTAMNAFATGRDPDNSVICATTGLLKIMNREELQGVVAHEMSHIMNRDILVMTMAAVMVGVSVLLSDFLLRMFLWGGIGGNRRDSGMFGIALIVLGIVLAALTPLIAQMIKFAISRKREYLADATGAKLTRYPQGLASALRKISGDNEVLEAANKATAHMYIANPLKGQKMWFKSMFATHPPLEDRIAKLEGM
ncbi:M48 family metallopeptidase [Candidatus Micrarchaeota archaeon]|nr:M48 family metallopeptidase [Candidatus Micrarchaeota archaeon]MBU1939928.1 M48 family metallopeptidase [Candidatus Micrarchaeota archaeon]